MITSWDVKFCLTSQQMIITVLRHLKTNSCLQTCLKDIDHVFKTCVKTQKCLKMSQDTGTCKLRNEIETKRNEMKPIETKRNRQKRNETDRNETKRKLKRNETKSTETKRNSPKRNEIDRNQTKSSKMKRNPAINNKRTSWTFVFWVLVQV